MNMPKPSDSCQANEIFGCDSKGEEILRRIQQSQYLLSQFHACLKSNEFGKAEALIPDIVEIGFENVDSLCNQIEEAYEKQAVIVREQTYDHIASTLPGLQSFSAALAADGSREVILQWIASPDSKADFYYLVRKEIEPPASIDDGLVVFKGAQQSFSDITVPIGVPCCYSVFSSYKGRTNANANVLSSPVLYASAIESFQVDIEGCSTFAIANLTWIMPAYDPDAKLALELERIHGNERQRIYFTYDQNNYIDEDVETGETYRYELTLIVAGKRLEPVVREVTIKAMQELPTIIAYSNVQEDGQQRLKVEWPKGIAEICISSLTTKPVYYTREDFDRRHILLPKVQISDSFIIQAVYRFQTGRIVLGPKTTVISKDNKRVIYVSIEPEPQTILKLWGKKQWGMKLFFEGFEGTPISSITVSVENPDEEAKTFAVSAIKFKTGSFFKFPASWNVKSGTIIGVSLPMDNGVYIEYLTSQEIPD